MWCGGFTAIGVLGPYVAPFVAALIAGPVLFGRMARLLHRFPAETCSGTVHRGGALDQGGFGQLIVTLGRLVDPAEWRADRVRLDAAE